MELELELEADVSLQALSMEIVSVEEWHRVPKKGKMRGTRILTGAIALTRPSKRRPVLSNLRRIERISGVG